MIAGLNMMSKKNKKKGSINISYYITNIILRWNPVQAIMAITPIDSRIQYFGPSKFYFLGEGTL